MKVRTMSGWGVKFLDYDNVGKLNHWLGVQLKGKVANPDAVGAKVTWQSGDFKRHMYKVAGGGYLSSHDPRLVLGIGARTRIDSLEIKWPPPSNRVDRLTNLPIDRYITIHEGQV